MATIESDGTAAIFLLEMGDAQACVAVPVTCLVNFDIRPLSDSNGR